jgi:hypothetical protein
MHPWLQKKPSSVHADKMLLDMLLVARSLMSFLMTVQVPLFL